MSGLRVAMLLENNAYPHDVRVRREAEALTAAGHRVTVVAPNRGDQPRREDVNGVEVRRFHLPEGSGVAGLLIEYAIAHTVLISAAAWQLVRGADVVHLHNPPDTLFPAAVLARALGRRAVYDHHDLAPELFEAKFGGGAGARWAGRAMRAAQRAAVRSAHATIVTNESQWEAVQLKGGSAMVRAVVVRNDPERASIARAPRVRPGALSEPRLVFAGTLETQDGVLDLPELLGELDTARLTIVGDGTARPDVERLLAPFGDRVRFTGRVPHAEVATHLAQADIAVDPAPHTDMNDRSTMIKIGEYMAAGLPVVAYPLRETVVTGGHALLYGGSPRELASHVRHLAANESLRDAYATRALARARGFTWEASADRLVNVYDGLARRALADAPTGIPA